MIFYKICKFSLEKTLTENVLKILDEKKISWEYIWRIFYKNYNKIFLKKHFVSMFAGLFFFIFVYVCELLMYDAWVYTVYYVNVLCFYGCMYVLVYLRS